MFKGLHYPSKKQTRFSKKMPFLKKTAPANFGIFWELKYKNYQGHYDSDS
jgi:hypothetical protein